jgi:hypothetical protein
MAIRILATDHDVKSHLTSMRRMIFDNEGSNSCYYRVVRKSFQRQLKVDDVIWLYGNKDSRVCIHAVLTDKDHKVLVGENEKYPGRFFGEKGFRHRMTNELVPFCTKSASATGYSNTKEFHGNLHLQHRDLKGKAR